MRSMPKVYQRLRVTSKKLRINVRSFLLTNLGPGNKPMVGHGHLINVTLRGGFGGGCAAPKPTPTIKLRTYAVGACREVWRDYVPPKTRFFWASAAAKPPQTPRKENLGEAEPPQTPPLRKS